MSTIQTAAREYAQRPPDERFPSVQALIDDAMQEKNHSVERTYNLKDLRVVAVQAGPIADRDPLTSTNTLQLESPKGRARFTHWSFGQLARTLHAPAGYLRELPPAIAADAMNWGLQQSAAGESANLLVRVPNGQPTPIVRACTSEQYGRVWDAELYSSIQRTLMQHDARWTTPPTWSGEPAGAYRGDRDSFLILVNGGSIVNDPSAHSGRSVQTLDPSNRSADPGGMYRGLLVRNSEVGASSVTIEQILFRYICGNHMLWGAVVDQTFRRRHVGQTARRDTVREIARVAQAWTQASAGKDEAIIKLLIQHEIAHTAAAVVDELKKIGVPEQQARDAYARCEQTESASPRSWWGMAQGLTRQSQDGAYQDDRYQLDRLAALVLKRGAKLVAA